MAYVYEKLDVWRKAMDFAIKLCSEMPSVSRNENHHQIIQETAVSSTSIAGAIAKGKAYASRHDFTQHLYHSRGLLYKTMTLLEILRRKKIITEEQFADFDAMGQKLAAMLGALIKSIFAQKGNQSKSGS